MTDVCIGCINVLGCLDEDPNGDKNATCAQCRAEESHDFDAEPDVTFDRAGHRIEPEPEHADDLVVTDVDGGWLLKAQNGKEIFVTDETILVLAQRIQQRTKKR